MFAVAFPSNSICEKSYKVIVQKSDLNYKRDQRSRPTEASVTTCKDGAKRLIYYILDLMQHLNYDSLPMQCF